MLVTGVGMGALKYNAIWWVACVKMHFGKWLPGLVVEKVFSVGIWNWNSQTLVFAAVLAVDACSENIKFLLFQYDGIILPGK